MVLLGWLGVIFVFAYLVTICIRFDRRFEVTPQAEPFGDDDRPTGHGAHREPTVRSLR